MSDFRHPDDDELARWSGIRTFRQFGAATAEWLDGKTAYMPTYAVDRPDLETAAIAEDLAAINRHGFVTHESQPGIPPDDNGSAQRAYVTGYCDEATAAKVCAGLRDSELVVIQLAPRAVGDVSVAVTLDEGEEFSWLGRGDSVEAASIYLERAGESLAALVRDAWELQIFDPSWGRNDRLLPALREVLEVAR